MPKNVMHKSKRRVLYVAVSQGHLSVFHNPYIDWLRKRGYEVDIAARAVNGFPLAAHDSFHDIAFARSPLSLANFRALMRMIRILRAQTYTLVHTHTPVASALTRLAALFAKGRPTVIYTAHGFHFYPRGPIANWLVWFTLEWFLTRLTDIVVTINKWDYDAALRLLKARRVRLLPGIGVNLTRFQPLPAQHKSAMRRELGLPEDAFVILYVAEFIPRKNHAFLIDAFAEVIQALPEARLVLVGDGPLEQMVVDRATERGIRDAVILTGFRRDVAEIASAADLAVSSSRHEGLPIGIVEAMACGLPVVASEDRGHAELVVEGQTGFRFAQNDRSTFVDRALSLARDPALRAQFSTAGQVHVRKFELGSALATMEPVYCEAEALFDQRSRGG